MVDKDCELTMETVELVLEEADRYGIRYEVEETAIAYLKNNPDANVVDAYQTAFADWVGIYLHT